MIRSPESSLDPCHLRVLGAPTSSEFCCVVAVVAVVPRASPRSESSLAHAASSCHSLLDPLCSRSHTQDRSAARAAAAEHHPRGFGRRLPHVRDELLLVHKCLHARHPPEAAFARKRAPSHIYARPPMIRCTCSRCFARRRRRKVTVRPWFQDRAFAIFN